jgi:hypothetical protein
LVFVAGGIGVFVGEGDFRLTIVVGVEGDPRVGDD